MNKCKDCMGHPLNVKDWVSILPPPNTIWIGRIEEVNDGGISLSIDRNSKGVTPAKIKVILDITLNANPQMPIFANLVKVSPPGSDELEEKIMEAVDNEPPPSGPLTM